MDLIETSIFEEGIYQIETTDPAVGGPVDEGGIANLQAQQLANRTRWLYENRGIMTKYTNLGLAANYTIPADDLFNAFVLINPEANGRIATLDVDSLPVGTVITINIASPSAFYGRCVAVKPSTGVIFTKTGFNDPLWLHTGETVQLVKADSGMRLVSCDAAIYDVGEMLYKWKAPVNSVQAMGQLVNRADYPRLWQWLSTTIPGGVSGTVITDADWLGSGLTKSGCFSSGNGSTTFRLPDLRGMFLRGQDNSRGIDTGRTYALPGGYQADSIASHGHIVGSYNATINLPTSPVAGAKASGVPTVEKFASAGNPNIVDGGISTDEAGSLETRPKNLGFTAYIKY